MALASGMGGGSAPPSSSPPPPPSHPPSQKKIIEENQKPKDVLERLGSFRYGVVWLPLKNHHLSCIGFWKWHFRACKFPPSNYRLRRSFSLPPSPPPPPPNKFLATAMLTVLDIRLHCLSQFYFLSAVTKSEANAPGEPSFVDDCASVSSVFHEWWDWNSCTSSRHRGNTHFLQCGHLDFESAVTAQNYAFLVTFTKLLYVLSGRDNANFCVYYA